MTKCKTSVKSTVSEEKVKIPYIIATFISLVIILSAILYCSVGGMDTLGQYSYIRNVSIDLTGMILCGILIFSLIRDKPWDAQNRSLYRLIFTLCLLFHFDFASSFMEGNPQAAKGVLVINTASYFADTLIVFCFFRYVIEELHLSKKSVQVMDYICKVVLAIDLISDLLNVKFGFFFKVNANGEYVSGKMESLTEITTFIIYIIIMYLVLKQKNHSIKEKLILLTFQIFPIIAHFSSMVQSDYSLVFPTYLFSIMLIYINLFAARGKRLLEQEAELNKQRAQLMVSQIQPHFLYNVLTTISNLCTKDPEEAEETTVLFSQYLRTNLDSLRQTEPVPFSVELGHIKTYVELEKKRFGDKLNVIYDCQETGFLVPALGLQPIAENCVKHGIRGKTTPGTLKISSCKKDDGFEVVIQDDGVGFDMNAPLPDDGRSHVGMKNVKSRLEQMCGARVTVESSPGNGCKTTVFFPPEDAV